MSDTYHCYYGGRDGSRVSIVTWYALIVNAEMHLSDEERDELRAWEEAHLDMNVSTSDWPGWSRHVCLELFWPWAWPQGGFSTYVDAHRSERKQKIRIPAWLRKLVMERDAYRCQRCDSHIDLEIDHVIPESRGGSTEETNLQVLCKPCNASKGARR